MVFAHDRARLPEGAPAILTEHALGSLGYLFDSSRFDLDGLDGEIMIPPEEICDVIEERTQVWASSTGVSAQRDGCRPAQRHRWSPAKRPHRDRSDP